MQLHYHKRNLPHFYPDEATFFITFRLYGSIPKVKLFELQRERQKVILKITKSIQAEEEKKRLLQMAEGSYLLKIDNHLDKNLNAPYWLQKNECAQIVHDALHFQNGRNYKLWAFCIMPNHVHLLFSLLPKSESISKIMMKLKGYSARQCNHILKKTGKFWQEESFDRVVRKGRFDSTLNYVLNNPVKAGWVANWQDWKWTYCNPELL